MTELFLLRFSAKTLRLSICLCNTGLSVGPLTSEILSRVLCSAERLSSTARRRSSSTDNSGTAGGPVPSSLASSTGASRLTLSQNKRSTDS